MGNVVKLKKKEDMSIYELICSLTWPVFPVYATQPFSGEVGKMHKTISPSKYYRVTTLGHMLNSVNLFAFLFIEMQPLYVQFYCLQNMGSIH